MEGTTVEYLTGLYDATFFPVFFKSLNNLTPEDVSCGQGQSNLDGRRKLKEKTLKLKKQWYYERKTA